MSSRQARFAIPAAAVLAAAGFWWVRRAHAQPADQRVEWEYATVEALQEYGHGSAKLSTANICYHANNGCRWDTIRISVDRWGRTHDGLVAATARLGERGWEAVSVTSPNEIHLPSVLLKRARPAEAGQ